MTALQKFLPTTSTSTTTTTAAATTTTTNENRNCKEIKDCNTGAKNGKCILTNGMTVWCDIESDGGGWTLVFKYDGINPLADSIIIQASKARRKLTDTARYWICQIF